jgi:tRNA/rRNA methyltransferase
MYKPVADPKPELDLPIHRATRFVLVRPHYPENVGAAARAIKTMGFSRLVLVKPGRLAVPEHEMAIKMAVKSRDVLGQAAVVDSLDQALAAVHWVLATTSRRGVSGVLVPRTAARRAVDIAQGQTEIAVVFGNEKTGLSREDLERAHDRVRIPMAADQPSVNLAQATQILAYEFLAAALDSRAAQHSKLR